jgi:hypothetical protein
LAKDTNSLTEFCRAEEFNPLTFQNKKFDGSIGQNKEKENYVQEPKLTGWELTTTGTDHPNKAAKAST